MEQSDLIKMLLDEVKHRKVLPPSRYFELGPIIRSNGPGSKEAMREIVESNIRYVVKTAYNFKGRGVPLIDLIQEGCLGIKRAAELFDENKGFKFPTYATFWIKQRMKRVIQEQSRTVRVPVYAQEGNGSYEVTELARNAKGVSNIEFNEGDLIPEARYNDSPLDKLIQSDELQTLYSNISKHLSEREEFILTRRYGLNGSDKETLEKISKQLKISRERVRQIENEAKGKLRNVYLNSGI